MDYKIYRVQKNDTLSRIAKKFDMSLNELIEINPQIENPDIIYIGQPVNVFAEKEEPVEPEPEDRNLPEWYLIAKKEMAEGVKEIRGSEHNPRVLEYHSATSLKATDDETPWCSSFVNWCVKQAGLKGTNSAAARSWLNWGAELDSPKEGCIVVLSRGNNPWQGHVGFFVDVREGKILILGGNQSNEVNISYYSGSRLLSYRWPEAE